MPLEAPRLDTRTYEDLVRLARLRIPRYTKEWTDFNDSDPGMTLVQLFAWLTEMMLFQMNRVPERSYIKFLKLLGMERKPAQPARAQLTFTAQPGAATPIVVPEGTRVAGQDPDTGELVVFETEKGIDVLGLELASIRVYDGISLMDLTAANGEHATPYDALGASPQVNNALYLGFGPAEEERKDEPFDFPLGWNLRVFLPEDTSGGETQRVGPSEESISIQDADKRPEIFTEILDLLSDDALVQCPPDEGWEARRRHIVDRLQTWITTPIESVPVVEPKVQWEYQSSEDVELSTWRRFEAFEDTTECFTREGIFRLDGPRKARASVLGSDETLFYWIRCRLVSGAHAAGTEPRIDFVRPNTVEAVNLTTREDEVLGVSNGREGQVFTFNKKRRPVDPDSLELKVEDRSGNTVLWQPTEDLRASGPDDCVYHLNANAGTVTFGDGEHGRIPLADSRIIAARYRYGGGEKGNLPAGKIDKLLRNIPGIGEVKNERKAVGGTDEQSLEELKKEAPGRLRRRSRAVTGEDFQSLAGEIGGVARATAIPLAHPHHPDIPVPGSVTVVVVPDNEDVPPRPSRDLLREVARKLDEHRLITTEVHVKGPRYFAVHVTVKVAAKEYASFGQVRTNIDLALRRFLSPLPWQPDPSEAAGPDEDGEPAVPEEPGKGWDFGQDLYPTQLYGVIQAVKDVVAVEHLEVAVKGLPHEDLTRPVRIPLDGLVYGVPEHEINVDPSRDM